MTTILTKQKRANLNAKHKRACSTWYKRGQLAVISALRAGLNDTTEPPTMEDLRHFCDLAEANANNSLVEEIEEDAV